MRLWWDPYTGGQGAIYVHSDNNPNNLLMGTCQNASRVVKYVVVMGQGYASNPLLDMRIHDINVVADLNRLQPDNPVESDGTGTPTSGERAAADIDLTQAMQSITSYWTGWWPLLHVIVTHQVQHPQTTLTVQTHTAKNILGVTEYSTCSVTGDAGVLGPANEDDEWMKTHLQTIIPAALVAGIFVAAGALEFAIKLPPPSSLAVFGASLALSMLVGTAVVLPSVFAYYMVEKGEWTRNDAGRFLWEIAFGWLLTGLGLTIPIVLGQAGAATGILSAVATAIAQLSWLANLLKFCLIAGISILLVGVALFIGAQIWFNG